MRPSADGYLHSVRSKRGFVHTPGAVSANQIDLALMARVADWTIAELLRIYNRMDLAEAQGMVDSLAYRDLPHLWKIGGKTRIMVSGLTFKEKVLLIAYDSMGEALLVEDVLESVEHSNSTVFRRDVLRPLHDDRLIEYDRESESITISPKGMAHVEDQVLATAGN